MYMELSIRKTHKFVGTYQHEDAWDYIGKAYVEASKTVDLNERNFAENPDAEPDMCNPFETTHFVRVESEESDEKIKQALRDSFSRQGCEHEYDCCGCRSYYVKEAKKLGQGYWKLSVYSSQNY